MDFLTEQTVHRKLQPKDILYKMLLISSVIFIPALCVVIGLYTNIHYCFVVAFFLLLLCIYGAWYFWTSLRIDYEYSINSGVLTISKIVDNRNRKHMVNIELRTIENIEKYNPEKHDNHNYTKVYVASEGQNAENLAAIFPLKNQAGMFMLVFSPNEKIRTAMKRYLRADLRDGI